ncbi:MAG TPA: TIGR03621 family F420-dependent LLM class oxidoreductase [Candidatus Binatia bacterium]|nr:TIGR03621 family F420-dependent LLM class oxidoreductase [Candidatus Binatia bacterium]
MTAVPRHPFRFGVNMRSASSGAAWAEAARRVEALGYSTLTVPDHFTEMFSPMPAIVVAAAATTRLRVGTLVLNNDFRHPVLLAREAALVDLLSDGRLQLGLGAGYMKSEYEQAGVPFDRGGVRVARLAEAVTILKGLLRGDTVTFTGHHYRVTGHAIHPRPRQQPHPPILIGGNGRHILTLAACEADIVALTGVTFSRGGAGRDFSGFTAEGTDERLRWIREVASERLERLELNALVQRVIVTGDRAKAADELARQWAPLTAADILESPFVLLGTVDEIAEVLRRRRERWGISYYVVMEPAMDALAPVVARLAGS